MVAAPASIAAIAPATGPLPAEPVAVSERLAHARAAIAHIADPEIPVLTLGDLGVIRDVTLDAQGVLEVAITPTYSGCPAMATMALDLGLALAKAGFTQTRIRQVLTPAWTTDWMSAAGRDKLRAYGIAPPPAKASRRALFGEETAPQCPLCGSAHTEKLSEFGSTACKAHWRCTTCLEPFDAFKCL